jgi:hypothetical protein
MEKAAPSRLYSPLVAAPFERLQLLKFGTSSTCLKPFLGPSLGDARFLPLTYEVCQALGRQGPRPACGILEC